MTFDPTGKFIHVISNEVQLGGPAAVNGYISTFALGPTGGLTSVGTLFAGPELAQMTFAPSGRFAYVTALDPKCCYYLDVYSINSSTGVPTAVTGTTVGNTVTPPSLPSQVALDPTGQFAYVADSRSGNVFAYGINASTALAAVTGSPFAAGANPTSVTVTRPR
jgi:DNA-binding beta-propeller fold protein YncE